MIRLALERRTIPIEWIVTFFFAISEKNSEKEKRNDTYSLRTMRIVELSYLKRRKKREGKKELSDSNEICD